MTIEEYRHKLLVDGPAIPKQTVSTPRQQAVAYQTVRIYAGITKRPLRLRSGSPPFTDGRTITVPLDNLNFYELLEHELAHILFRSNAKAKNLFIQEYVPIMQQYALQQGRALDPMVLTTFLDTWIGLLEDARVNSLWNLLYPGSGSRMTRMGQQDARRLDPNVCMTGLMAWLSYGLDPPNGAMTLYRPVLQEALDRVRLRGFPVTLLTMRWLVMQLVSATILGPQEPKPRADDPLPDRSEGRSSEEDESPGGWSDEEDLSAFHRPSGGSLRDLGHPRDVGTPTERAEVFQNLVAHIQKYAHLSRDGVNFPIGDSVESEYRNHGEDQAAKNLVNIVMNFPATEDAVPEALDRSRQDMLKLVDGLKHQLASARSKDDKLRHAAEARVSIRKANDHSAPLTRESINLAKQILRPEDAVSVSRLRARFVQEQGRRRNELEEAGLEIDIQTLISNRLSGMNEPAFKAEQASRGFKALILIDLSQSMNEPRPLTPREEAAVIATTGKKPEPLIPKIVHACRACMMLCEALRYPFVDLNVWGFQSNLHEVEITKATKIQGHLVFDGFKLGGNTPLHTAVKMGVRFLEDGGEAKHLIVITDGVPTHRVMVPDEEVREYKPITLMEFVRKDVQRANMKRINVTAVAIGEEIPDYYLTYMFGSKQHWRRVTPARLGADLVSLVSSSFVSYLRA